MEGSDASAPIATEFDLEKVIKGLAADLEDLRAGKITPADARVRADMAKQIMNGVRMVISARKFMQEHAKLIGQGGGS